MNIRVKIILIVLPLVITPLLLTGVITSLSARNGITTVATEFLQFKTEELTSYASSQWDLLVANQLQNDAAYVQAAEAAVESFARNLIRRPTELIFAIDREGSVSMETADIAFTPTEREALQVLAASGARGWQTLVIGEIERVAHTAEFSAFGWYFFVTEHRATFYSTTNAIVQQMTIILAVALSVSIALLLLFSGIITRPLRDVVGAMTDIITNNDLSRRVEVVYGDETGKLGHTFNLMTGELEKAYDQIKSYALKAVIAQHREQKIRNIFQKYVPTDVIDEFFTNPEGMLTGQDRILALLFSDIRGFTGISENMLPNEVVESLNTYFGMMVDIIIRHKGIVDKYMGDAIMAFFGAPVRHRDEAYQSVLSAFEMLSALKEFNEWQRHRERPEFNIGIGINYGVVTVGNIGSEKKMDYTVIGDMVNLASRMEGLTKVYKENVVISESVYKYISTRIPCRMIDKVVVKGKSSGIGIYTPREELSPAEEKAWKHHAEALQLYFKRDFDNAARLFQQVSDMLPGDTSSRLLLYRCRNYIKTPPAPDWEGAVVMSQK